MAGSRRTCIRPARSPRYRRCRPVAPTVAGGDLADADRTAHRHRMRNSEACRLDDDQSISTPASWLFRLEVRQVAPVFLHPSTVAAQRSDEGCNFQN